MSFYLNQEKLADHLDDLRKQIQLVRLLQDKVRLLYSSTEPEQGHLLRRCMTHLEDLEQALSRLQEALRDHNTDMDHLFHQISVELDDIEQQLNRVFS